MLVICASCKKPIRGESAYEGELVSHGMCLDCAREMLEKEGIFGEIFPIPGDILEGLCDKKEED